MFCCILAPDSWEKSPDLHKTHGGQLTEWGNKKKKLLEEIRGELRNDQQLAIIIAVLLGFT